MGQLRVTMTVNPRVEGEPRRLEAIVDTGAGYTVVPRPVLDALGCEPHRMQPVRFEAIDAATFRALRELRERFERGLK